MNKATEFRPSAIGRASPQSSATLIDVVNHYDAQFKLNLTAAQKIDLVEYLKGIRNVSTVVGWKSVLVVALAGSHSVEHARKAALMTQVSGAGDLTSGY